jgi:hypothetical protein
VDNEAAFGFQTEGRFVVLLYNGKNLFAVVLAAPKKEQGFRLT